MGLEVNTIITLSNNEKYVVLNETLYSGKKYFLTMGVDEKKEVQTDNVAIFEEELEGLDTYVKKVTDSELMIKLTSLLKEQM